MNIRRISNTAGAGTTVTSNETGTREFNTARHIPDDENEPDTMAELENEMRPDSKKPDDFTFIIVSDGSGFYKDGVGAACSYLFFPPGTLLDPVLSAHTDTTTTRMEFQGLLQALRVLKTRREFYSGCRGIWFCDNESMVKSVSGEHGRNANEDLWLLYDYHTWDVKLEARHIPRDNKLFLHNLADLHASTMRNVLTEYIRSNINTEYKSNG